MESEGQDMSNWEQTCQEEIEAVPKPELAPFNHSQDYYVIGMDTIGQD